MTVTPVNYRKQDNSPEAIARDVTYALQIADFYVAKLPSARRHLGGVNVLELGPGYSLGSAVALACHGARVSVADRYLSPYDKEYHGPFLRALAQRMAAERPELDTAPIETLLAAESFVPEVVDGLHLGIEDLAEIDDGSFDLVVSNAVFEHVGNVPRAFTILARITRPGGVGIHQVDFRDHRDFSRPLEYLTLPGDDFAALFAEVHGECGNRWRPDAMGLVIAESGFEVSSFEANMQADETYLDELLPRLSSDYAGMSRESLRAISGCFVLRRRAALGEAAAAVVDSPAGLARRRGLYALAEPFVPGKRVLDLGCGTGAGVRRLLGLGAEQVLGLDADAASIDAARPADPRGDEAWEAYVHHDPELPLPFAAGSFDVVVAYDVLDQVHGQARLCSEIWRVLGADGLAFVSRDTSADHDSATALERFLDLLSPFDWVDFHGLVDVVAAVAVPLDCAPDQTLHGRLELPPVAGLGDPSVQLLVARCFRTRPMDQGRPSLTAHGYGTLADALNHRHRDLPAGA